MIIDEWHKFKGWTVLEFFLNGNRAYIKELSRLLRVSPQTAQRYSRFYESEGVLDKESVGNASLYALADTPLTRELKRAYLLMKIFPKVSGIAEKNAGLTGLALYGSAASGEYDKSSDIDLLAISGSPKLDLGGIKDIERLLGREVHIEIMSIGRWRSLGEKKDAFYLSVSKNHLVLYGVLP